MQALARLLFQRALQQAAHEFVGRFGQIRSLQTAQGFVQPRTQAGFQFGGGGFGEGDDQYFVHRHFFQQDQAGKQGGDAVGFARTGRGFDQGGAGNRNVEGGEGKGGWVHGALGFGWRPSEKRNVFFQTAFIVKQHGKIQCSKPPTV